MLILLWRMILCPVNMNRLPYLWQEEALSPACNYHSFFLSAASSIFNRRVDINYTCTGTFPKQRLLWWETLMIQTSWSLKWQYKIDLSFRFLKTTCTSGFHTEYCKTTLSQNSAILVPRLGKRLQTWLHYRMPCTWLSVSYFYETDDIQRACMPACSLLAVFMKSTKCLSRSVVLFFYGRVIPVDEVFQSRQCMSCEMCMYWCCLLYFIKTLQLVRNKHMLP